MRSPLPKPGIVDPGTTGGREARPETREAGPETQEAGLATPMPEAVTPPTKGPTGAPATQTTHLQGHVDCTGSSGRLHGRVQTGTTAPGATTSHPGQETTGTLLPQLKLKIEKLTSLTRL